MTDSQMLITNESGDATNPWSVSLPIPVAYSSCWSRILNTLYLMVKQAFPFKGLVFLEYLMEVVPYLG